MKIMKTGTRWLALLLLSLASSVAQAGTKSYYYTDPQGTVLAKADQQGNIVETYDYAPYGVQVLGTPPEGPTGYTGHVNDGESGFVYMQQRYMDPQTGRFLSVDPIWITSVDVFSFNRYIYANGNPIVNVDPSGEATVYVQKNGDIHIVQSFINNDPNFSDEQISSAALLLVGRTSSDHLVSVTLMPAGKDDVDIVSIVLDNSLDDLDNDDGNNSHTNKIGGRQISLAPNANTTTVSHEFGHVFGAGDRRVNGVDAQGRVIKFFGGNSNNLMGNGNGPLGQESLDEIYNSYRRDENTIINCTNLSEYCTQ